MWRSNLRMWRSKCLLYHFKSQFSCDTLNHPYSKDGFEILMKVQDNILNLKKSSYFLKKEKNESAKTLLNCLFLNIEIPIQIQISKIFATI